MSSPAFRTDWLMDADQKGPKMLEAPIPIRDAIAAAWLEDALLEHASIASFARFSLGLLAVGAPPELIGEAQRAGADEVEHARLCFSLAERFGGETRGPGPLPLHGLTLPSSLAAMVVDAVHEGCIGETIAALVATEQRRIAVDPAARRVLGRIAADEARHAELAWRFVAWACAIGGKPVREATATAFAAGLSAPGPASTALSESDVLYWHRAGRLTPTEVAQISYGARRDVIADAARSMLGDVPPVLTRAQASA